MRISDWSSDVCSSDLCAVIGWMNLVARSDVPKAESAIAVQSRDGIDLPRHRSTIWIDPCHPSPTKSRAKIRSEEHTSELQSLMRISYAVFCLKKKKTQNTTQATRKKQRELTQSQPQ